MRYPLFLPLVLSVFFMLSGLRAAYTWSNVAVNGGGYVTGVVYHPSVQNLVYARTDVGGAYRWDQATTSWIALNDDIGGLNNDFMMLGVLSLALDPADSQRVYMACGQYLASWAPAARLLRSTDRGATWTQITLPFKLAGNGNGRGTGERLAVDPNDGARLYFGTSDVGFWRSTDRGSNWTRMTNFTPLVTTFVLPDRLTPGVVYAGAGDAGATTLWRSSDYGVNWTSIVGQPAGLFALQAALDGSGTLYTTYANALGPNGATSGSVRKLVNAATSTSAADWTTIDPPAGQGGFCGLSLDLQHPGVVVVSTLDRWYPRDEIYYSANGGTSWKGVLDGATLDRAAAPWTSTLTPHWVTDVEIDPFNSSRATFVTGFGLFTATNLDVASGKPTWAFNNKGLEETVPTALVSPSAGPSLVSTIGDFGGFRHDSLTVTPSARISPNSGSNHSLDGAGSDPTVLVRVHGSASISRNTGTSWTVFPTQPPTAANGEGRIVVSADGTRVLWCPTNSTPYWTVDDGQTWTASTGAPDGSGGSLYPAADRVVNDFYVYDPAGRLVYRSANGGVSFVAVSTQLPTGSTTLRSVPGRAGELWASSDGNGLRRLTNNGATITQVSGVQAAYGFGFGKAATNATHPSVFIWGTIGGVVGLYRSDDTGAFWTRINDNAHQFGRTTTITGDPRVFGRVYLSTSGRGIIMGEPVGTPPPDPQASQPIYVNALASNWTNVSWATVSFSATSPVRRGANSISVTAGSFAAIALNHANMSTTGYTALGFWIHGGTVGGQSLRIRALRNGVNQPAINLTAPLANTWTRVVIPLDSLGVANVSDLSGFLIQNLLNSTLPVFYLDDITLVGDADAALWSASATATVTLGSLSAVYDGDAKFATATTSPGGLPVNFTYSGGASAPVSAGTYTVVGTVDAASNAGSATASLIIDKSDATVTLGDLSAVYDGAAKAATATTSPANLPVTFTYDGSATAPSAAGSYTVVGTINHANYTGTASGTLTIAKASATVTLGSLSAVYDGTAKAATATTNPANLPVTFTYDGSVAVPSAAGSYAVVGMVNHANYIGTALGALTIAKATATVTLGDLSAAYDGAAKVVTATTNPENLPVAFIYDGSATAPSAVGTYAVVGTITGPNYSGTATGQLIIRMSLAGFQARYFTVAERENGAISGSLADPDADGLVNLLEYAFVCDPRNGESGAMPTLSVSSGRLTLDFIRRRDVTDLGYEVEVSNDLHTWSFGPTETEQLSVQPLDEIRDRVTVRDLTAFSGVTRRFMRLRVNHIQ